jgi:hypothetical protein
MNYDKTIQRFDPHLRANESALKKAISDFASHLEAREKKAGERTRARRDVDRAKFHLAIEVLLVNLALAYARSPPTLLSIPLSNTTLRGNPRYRPLVYGKHFRDLVTLLHDLRLIKFVTKGHNVRDWGRRQSTTIIPTARLLKVFPSITRVANGKLTRTDPTECVVLKSGDGQLLNYADNRHTRRWRSEMNMINNSLRDAAITVFSGRLIDEGGFAIRPDMRSLRRLWNNGDWSQGGRLYDGFWQTMKREDRLSVIRIDGGPIANVDFSQFNLRLAYALAKAKPPRGDLYDVTGKDAYGRSWKRLREGRKKLTNAMFNRDKPLKQWPGKSAEDRKALAACFQKGTTARSATGEIKTKHCAIAHYFESGCGLRFMRIESDILVASLLSLIRRGITALPVHDAVLVAERHAKIAKATLEMEAKRRVRVAIPAEIKTRADQ